jgi:Vacuolar sorting protein 39 domain 1
VDTVFLRLLAERKQTEDLLEVLNEPNFISWQEAEGDLIRHGQYYVLDKLYEKNGLDRRRIEILAKFVFCIIDDVLSLMITDHFLELLRGSIQSRFWWIHWILFSTSLEKVTMANSC